MFELPIHSERMRRRFAIARLPPVAIILMMTALAIFALVGCTTSRNYRMAKTNTPPAVPLNYIATVPALELRLVAVIVNQGPGSWKQDALWDEYIVSLINRSSGPLTGESVGLVDLRGWSRASNRGRSKD